MATVSAGINQTLHHVQNTKMPIRRHLVFLALFGAAASAVADPPIMGGHAVFTSNDGKYGVIWRNPQKFILVTCRDGHAIRILTPPPKSPNTFFSGIAFSGDGTKFSAAATDRVMVWESATGKLVRTVSRPATRFFDVALSQDGSSIITSTNLGVFLFPDAKATKAIQLHKTPGSPLTAYKDTFLFTGAGDRSQAYLYSSQGKLIKNLKVAAGDRFSPSGRFVAAAGFGVARLTNLENDQLVTSLVRQNAGTFWEGEKLVIPSDNGLEQLDPATHKVSRYKGAFVDGMYLYYGKKQRTAFFDFYSRRLLGYWPHYSFVDYSLIKPPARIDPALLNRIKITP